MKVGCAIIHYGSSTGTERTLNSLRDLRHASDLKVCVLENGMKFDATPGLTDKLGYEIQFIKSSRNLGFAAAVNRAANSLQDCDLIWMLNNDAIVEPNTMQSLVRVFEQYGSTVGAVGSVVLYDADPARIWFYGARCFQPACIIQHLKKGLDPNDPSLSAESTQVDVLTGCSLMVRRDIFSSLDGFDENFFMYGEDVDLSFRMRSSGYTLWLQPRSKVFHKVSSATGGAGNLKKEYYLSRNGYILISKYAGILPVRLLGYSLRFCWDTSRIILAAKRKGKSLIDGLKISIKALNDFRTSNLGECILQ